MKSIYSISIKKLGLIETEIEKRSWKQFFSVFFFGSISIPTAGCDKRSQWVFIRPKSRRSSIQSGLFLGMLIFKFPEVFRIYENYVEMWCE